MGVVWRALQAYRKVAPAGEAPLAKGAGFSDALIVFKALRLASDHGESLNAVYTFDAAMRSLPHTASLSRDWRTEFCIYRPVMDLLPATTTMRQGSRNRNGTSPTLRTVTRHLRRAAPAPATPTAQEASGRGVCAQLLHGRRAQRGVFPRETPQRGNTPLGRGRDACFGRAVNPYVPSAWVDRSKDKIGYEIDFSRHFCKYMPPRPLEETDAELKKVEEEINRLLREVIQ